MAVGTFRIDGVEIPAPSEYKFNVEDLSSEATGRTLDGTMHKDVVAVKDTYECKWRKLSWAKTAILMNAVDGKTSVQFTHADPRVANMWITGNFYIGKRDCSANNLADPANAWTDISMTFIRI